MNRDEGCPPEPPPHSGLRADRHPHARSGYRSRDSGVHRGRRPAAAPAPRAGSGSRCRALGTEVRSGFRLSVGVRRRARVRTTHPISRSRGDPCLLGRRAATDSRRGPDLAPAPRARVGEFFDVLGVQPVIGRALQPSDDVYGAAPVMVLSYGAWQGRFGGDTHVLGRQLIMYEDGVPYTIVGVMPQGLDYPRGTDFWTPVSAAIPPKGLPFVSLHVIGRLAPRATITDARAELTTFFGRAEASPWGRDLRGVVQTLPRLVLGDVRPALFVFAAASALLLLITCINVASLLLVRGVGRFREIAVRTALGAGRGRLIAQLLIENGILAALGAAFGIVVPGLHSKVSSRSRRPDYPAWTRFT